MNKIESYTLNLKNINWVRYETDKKSPDWYYGQTSGEIYLDRPNWVVMRSARFLKTRKNNQTVLEIVLENLSNLTYSMNNLSIRATHDWGILCNSGAPPKPWQKITLDWSKLFAEKLKDDAVWTNLNSLEIAVKAEFKAANCGDSFHRLYLEIPIQQEIKPNSVKRISLIINELPDAVKLSKPAFRARSAPSLLARWHNIKLSFSPEQSLYPKSISVKR